MFHSCSSSFRFAGGRIALGSKRIFTESRTLSEHRVEKWRWLKIAAGYQAAEWKSIREAGSRWCIDTKSCRVVSFLLSSPSLSFCAVERSNQREGRNMSGAISIWIIRNFLYLVPTHTRVYVCVCVYTSGSDFHVMGDARLQKVCGDFWGAKCSFSVKSVLEAWKTAGLIAVAIQRMEEGRRIRAWRFEGIRREIAIRRWRRLLWSMVGSVERCQWEWLSDLNPWIRKFPPWKFLQRIFVFVTTHLFEEFSNLLENWKNVRTYRDFRMEIYLKFAPYFTASRFLSLPCIR